MKRYLIHLLVVAMGCSPLAPSLAGPLPISQKEERPLEEPLFDGKPYFFKVRVARDRRGKVTVLLGQWTGRQLRLMDADRKMKIIPSVTGQLTFKKKPKPRPSKNKPKKQPTKKRVSSSKKNLAVKPKLQQQIPVQSKPMGLSYQQPMLKFGIKSEQLKLCTGSGVYRSFLLQAEVFKTLLGSFEVVASGSNGAACARAIAKSLISRGFRAQVLVGSLPKGGVSVRAPIGNLKPRVAVRPKPKVKARPPKKKPVLPPVLQAEELPVPEPPIVVEGANGRKFLLRPGEDGFFILSFMKEYVRDILPLKIHIDGSKVFKVNELAELSLGATKVGWPEILTAQVGGASWDSINRIKVPEAMQEAIINDYEKRVIKGQSRVTGMLGFVSFDGNQVPVAKQTFTPMISGAQAVSSKYHLFYDATLPLTTNSEAPAVTELSGELAWWLVGSRTSARLNQRIGVSVGGFYYRAEKLQVAYNQGGVSITELFGALFGLRGQLDLGDGLSFEGGLSVAPMVPTAATRFTNSFKLHAQSSYCWDKQNCAMVRMLWDEYRVDYITLGEAFASRVGLAGGWTYFFK